MIPSAVLGKLVTRNSCFIERYVHSPRRELIYLNVIRDHIALGERIKGTSTEFIITNCTNEMDTMRFIAEFCKTAGEIRRCSSKLFAIGEDIPKNLSDCHNLSRHNIESLSK